MRTTWVTGLAFVSCVFVAGCEELPSDNIPKENPSVEKRLPTKNDKEVSTNQAYEKGLEIGKQIAYKPGSESIPELADAIIKGKVHYGLKAAEVDRSRFEVMVKDGIIELKGKVASETQKASAEGVAVGVIGDKKKVKNNLSVQE